MSSKDAVRIGSLVQKIPPFFVYTFNLVTWGNIVLYLLAARSTFGNCYDLSEQLPHGGMIFDSGRKIPFYNPGNLTYITYLLECLYVYYTMLCSFQHMLGAAIF